ncbi:PIN-like domain-containing protein [Cellulomonas sp. Y8]|uniref:PIN-like domain-containing protein n=1 Tax=Cellulomonas sp. Y8 TaxID=2591145 RepID=UPI0011C761A6|nr:PIN-like domain-containing protein [Cellulomonas sp. Y8]
MSDPLLPDPPAAADPSAVFDGADVVLDANVLLSLYRVSATTRDAWFEALDRLHDRLVMPHQVAIEFMRNSDSVRTSLAASYIDLINEIEKLPSRPAAIFGGGRHVHADRIADLRATVQPHVDALLVDLRAARDQDRALVDADNDVVMHKVRALYGRRVLRQPTSDVLRARVRDFMDYRLPNRIPPGWKDGATKSIPRNAAGDYLLWAEVLEHAAAVRRPVLMVTDDAKDDWWLKQAGTMSAQPELVEEFARVVGLEYAQVTSKDFLELAQRQLGLGSDRQAVDETAEAAQASENGGLSIEEWVERFDEMYARLAEDERERLLHDLRIAGRTRSWGTPRPGPARFRLVAVADATDDARREARDEALRQALLRVAESHTSSTSTEPPDKQSDEL